MRIFTWIALAVGAIWFVIDVVLLIMNPGWLPLILAGALALGWTFCFLAFRHANWGKDAI